MIVDPTKTLKNKFLKGKKGLFPFMYRRIYDWQKPKSFLTQKTNYSFDQTGKSSFEIHGILLDNIARILLLSPTFKAMVDTTPKLKNVYMRLGDDEQGFASYQQSVVTIGQKLTEQCGLNPEAMIFSVAHEYRHAWQDHHNITGRSMGMSAEDSVILNKIIEADAVAFMITVCHELATIGLNGPLGYLMGSGFDIPTQTYLSTVNNNNVSEQTGTAQRAAYQSYLQVRPFEQGYALTACENFQKYRRQDGLKFKFKPFAFLIGVDKTLSSMPFYAEDGTLCQRPEYNIKPKTPQEIDLLNRMPSAQVECMVKHLDRHRPPRPIR